MKLTANSEESQLSDILETDNYFSIPLFQRQYVWNSDVVDELLRDFDNIVDQEDFSHFLGAIIGHIYKKSSAQSGQYEIIDGQQRLTTIYLFICAAVRLLSLHGGAHLAQVYSEKYLFLRRPVQGGSNAKLQPSLNDRAQLNKILTEIDRQPELRKALGTFTFIPLMAPSNSRDDGKLRRYYVKFQKFLKSRMEAENDGCKVIVKYLDAILLNLTMVEILTTDAATGPTIYNGLNSGQAKMTIGDLVRNGIFTKVSSSADEMIRLEETHWRPFYQGFDYPSKNYFDEYFFPYGLTIDPNLKKNNTYSRLQKDWANIPDATQIIENLKKHQSCFIDLKTGQNLQNLPYNLLTVFSKFRKMGAPASSYPFLMQLMDGYKNGKVSEKTCEDILWRLESFLVRRAVCGIEPTGLHAVFKRLWLNMETELSGSKLQEIISKGHKTVKWPTKEEFSHEIKRRPLYGSSITKYLLLEIDASSSADHPVNEITIEHVLPQSFSDDWKKDFTAEQHESLVDLLANLLPLSSPMNSSLQNAGYAIKRGEYSKNSMFKTTREFADNYDIWNFETISKRASELSDWAVSRWPY